MKFIKIINYKCTKCKCNEYSVVSFKPITIVCADCGEEYLGKYVLEED